MFQYLNWVSCLQGVSPIARLLGFRMANNASYVRRVGDPDDDEAACEIDLDATLTWIGCDEAEIRSAMTELAAEGMCPLRIDGHKILYSFPALEEWEPPTAKSAKQDYPLTIYVISAQPRVTKVGISKYPAYRLDNLQAANPTQRLNMVWKLEGPSSVIRRAERLAHTALAENSIGREWFTVTADVAIDAVRDCLVKAGLKL